MNRSEAEKLFEEYSVPDYVEKHSRAVNFIACALADKAVKKGLQVDKELLDIASLLHDLFKPVEFVLREPEKWDPDIVQQWNQVRQKFGEQHDFAVKEFLKDKYPEAGKLIVESKFDKLLNGELYSLEQKILRYADSKVCWDNIVSIKERHEEAIKRHGITEDQTKSFECLQKLEEDLVETIGFDPEELHGPI